MAPAPRISALLIAKPAQDLFGEFDARKRHRNRVNSQSRLAAHPFTDFQGALEQTVENAAGVAMIQRASISGSHLAQDFRFPEQHRIQARDDPVEMAHGLMIRVEIKRVFQLDRRQTMKSSEERFKTSIAFG